MFFPYRFVHNYGWRSNINDIKINNLTKVKDLLDLTDKVAVITGGGGLLGGKHAEALAEFGCKTLLIDIDEANAKINAKRVQKYYAAESHAFKCDITKKEEIQIIKNKILEKFGKIDILINNAAIDPKVERQKTNISFSRMEYFQLEQWNQELAVGLTGSFLCSQEFGQEMAKAGKGVIINISSDLGIIAPDQRLYYKEGLPDEQQPVKPVTYSVIKHGLIGLTKYLATYWADKGIRTNTLCPSGVYTNQPKEFLDKISKLIPIGRMAKPDEYKAAIIFLASDASLYMNGSTLILDGGRTIL